MKGTYWQKGEALDYLNSGTEKIEHGDIVKLGSRIGVAGDNILPGETGVVHVEGVFAFKSADSDEIAMGTEVYYSESGISAAKGDTGVKAGYIAAPSSGGSVYVKINA